MAANQVGQVEVRVVPDGSQFAPQLQAILDQAAGKAASAGATIGQSISRQVAPQVQMVGRSVADMNMQFDNAARKAAVFTGAVMGTKAVVEGMVGKLAGVFDQLAQAQAGFSAILGERKGNALLDEVRQFAKDTPFATKQLVNYSQQLLGVGMASEKIVPLLKDTGNVIASVGGDTSNISRVLYAMSQIQTVGRLMGQDAMQLQSALIPITKLLATYLNKSTQEVKRLQEQGRISAEQVFAAIQAAGQKVPNAMANAVKTIAGAREVLRDSIQILLQDAPALRMVYDDVVKGIQKVATVLSSDEVSGAIGRAFESVGKVYEALKPTIETFISTLGTGGLSSLKAFTSVLEVFGAVLEAIPQPALDLLAKVLATIAMLKAPMMLIKYVDQFKKMGEIFKTDGLLTNMDVAFKKFAAGEGPTSALVRTNQELAASYRDVGVAATAAGESIVSATSTARTAVAVSAANSRAEALTTATVTSAAGEATKSMVGGYEQYATTLTQEYAKKAAQRRIDGSGERLFSRNAMREVRQGGLRGSIDKYQSPIGIGLATVGGMMQTSENASVSAVGQMAQMAGMGAMVGGPWGAAAGALVGAATSIITASKEATRMEKEAWDKIIKGQAQTFFEQQQRSTGAQTGETAGAIRDKIKFYRGIVSDADVAYQTVLNKPMTSGMGNERVAEIAAAEKYATNAKELYGGMANDLQNQLDILFEAPYAAMKNVLGEEGPTTKIGQMFAGAFEQKTVMGPGGVAINTGAPQLTEDYQKLDDELQKYGMSLEMVGDIGEEATQRIINGLAKVSTEQQRAIAEASRFNQVYDKAKLAAEGLYGAQGKMASNTAATLSAISSGREAATKAFENQSNAQAQLQAQSAASAAQIAAYAQKMSEVTNLLEATTKLGPEQIEAIATAQALREAERVLDRLAVKSINTQEELQKQYGLTNDQLMQLLGLEKSIVKNQKIVVTADVQQALESYANLLAAQQLLEQQAKGGGMQFDTRLRLSQIKEAMKAIMGQFTDIPAGTSGGGGGGGQSFADKVKSAADMLKNSIESAMESVKGAAEAWKSTIKDRVQYEAAVSTGRALRNVQRQTADIATLQRGIAQLKSRGLTEEAIKALDINAITDVRQVKRLMSASPEELKRLSSAVAQRDKLASTLAADRQREENRKTITQAILEAAKILGYKFTDAQAKAISAQFNITTETDAKKMVDQILSALSGGKITASMTP